jgi:tRNA/tmRNA/rRNA uracil-C5-methylase (TrmA/RlmC/RlmD family)
VSAAVAAGPARAGEPPEQRGASLELEIGEPAYGGACLARLPSGRVCFVRHSLPGERVVARLTEVRSDFARADAVEVLRASPDRREPPCPVARPGMCGGCDWQHAVPAASRAIKAAVVAEQFRRVGHEAFDAGDLVVEALPGAGAEDAGTDAEGLGWRTRVQFATTETGRLGLRRHRSHTVQPVERCYIAAPGVEAVGAESRRWPPGASVEVIAGSDDPAATVVVDPVATPGRDRRSPAQRGRPRRPAAPAGHQAEQSLLPTPDLPPDVALLVLERQGLRALRGDAVVHERAAGRCWQVTGSGFWQVHPRAADTLAAVVVAAAGLRDGDRVLDLYSGVGLFTGALADAAPGAGLVAVEASRQACADARVNLADLMAAGRAAVEHADVLAALRARDPEQDGRVDVVVLDPPRAGAGAAVVAELVRLRPRRIVYVACEPAPLARDAAALQAAGYARTALRAFDLFPMTHHVECVATFEDRSGAPAA